MNQLHIEVEALDAGNGYVIKAIGIVNGEREMISEHRATEAEVQARLAFVWNWWAARVDAE